MSTWGWRITCHRENKVGIPLKQTWSHSLEEEVILRSSIHPGLRVSSQRILCSMFDDWLWWDFDITFHWSKMFPNLKVSGNPDKFIFSIMVLSLTLEAGSSQHIVKLALTNVGPLFCCLSCLFFQNHTPSSLHPGPGSTMLHCVYQLPSSGLWLDLTLEDTESRLE